MSDQGNFPDRGQSRGFRGKRVLGLGRGGYGSVRRTPVRLRPVVSIFDYLYISVFKIFQFLICS